MKRLCEIESVCIEKKPDDPRSSRIMYMKEDRWSNTTTNVQCLVSCELLVTQNSKNLYVKFGLITQ